VEVCDRRHRSCARVHDHNNLAEVAEAAGRRRTFLHLCTINHSVRRRLANIQSTLRPETLLQRAPGAHAILHRVLSQAQQGEGEPAGSDGAAAQTLHIAPRRSQQPLPQQRSSRLAAATSYDPPAPLLPPPLPDDKNLGGTPGGEGEGRSRGREADGARRSGGGRSSGVAGPGISGGHGGGGGRAGSAVSDPAAAGNGGITGGGSDPAGGTIVVACLVSFFLLLGAAAAGDGAPWVP